MGEFAKLIGRFFARDLLYLIAGANMILAFAIANLNGWQTVQPIENIAKLPTVLFVPLAGVAYVLGYTLSYLSGIAGLTSPGDRLVPWSKVHPRRGGIARWIFLRLNGYPIDEVARYIEAPVTFDDHTKVHPAAIFAVQALHPREDYLSRATTLHHLASVLGPSLVVCGVLFLIGHCAAQTNFSLPLAILTLAIGGLLCLDSNYRSWQIAYALAMRHRWNVLIESESDTG